MHDFTKTAMAGMEAHAAKHCLKLDNFSIYWAGLATIGRKEVMRLGAAVVYAATLSNCSA